MRAKQTSNIFTFPESVSLVLLALMVCLAVACKGGRGGGYDDDEEEKPECFLDRLTDEHLSSFDIDEVPLAQGGGQSQAFKIHPLDELVISAPAGAFEQNPNIHVSVASGQQLQAAEDKLAEMMPDHELLWGYDIDAGLPSDSVLPGKYTVKIDLKKLDIPKELHHAIRMFRMDDKGNLQQLNSRVKDGIIRYEACQNSVAVVTLSTIAIYMGYEVVSSVKVRMKAQAWAEAGFPLGFWNHIDLIQLSESDEFGSFNVLFRFTETERGNRFEEFKAKNKELEKRLAQLKKKATELYDKEHPSTITDWLASAVTMRKQRVGLDAIFYKMVNEDKEVERLKNDPDVEMPQSVLDIVKATKLANRFSRDSEFPGLGLKPLSYTYNVYLVPNSEMGEGEETTMAKFKPLYFLGGKVLVNYDSYLKKKGNTVTYDQKQLPAMCATMAHEIGHAFENEYIRCVRFSNMRFFEAIGSVTEHWFAAWMKKKGYVTIADTESKEADELFQYAKRDDKQLLAWPLQLEYPDKKSFINVDNPETHGGYMLGDLVQFLCDKKKKVTFDEIMTNYAYNKTFLQDLKDIFGIKSNSEFGELYTKFCFKFMPEIFGKQQGIIDEHLLKPIYKHSPTDCVVRLKNFGLKGTNKANPFAVKTTQFVSNTTRGNTPPYSLFAVPSKKVYDQELMFTFLEGDSLQQAKDSLYVTPCEKKYSRNAEAAIIYREFADIPSFDNDYYIDVVALYQPKQPKVLGLTKDEEGLNVHTGDEPAASLLKDPENPYVTGMQMVVINNKTKKKKLFNVPLEQCGQEVKIPFSKVGITDPDDIDISLRTRWYYENKHGEDYYSPATERVNYKKQKEQEKQEENKEENENDESFNEPSSEDVSEDLGDQAMGKQMLLKEINTIGSGEWSYVGTLKYKDSHPVYANVVLKSGRFKITIPSHQYDDEMHVQGFTLEGKYKVTTKYYIVYDNGREKDRIPYKYIEFQGKDTKLLAPFSIKKVEIGGDNEGHRVEFTQTWTHTQLPGEWSHDGGGIDLSRQEDLDTGERVLHINLLGHSHNVRNHEPKEAESDVLIYISGELK